MENIFERESNQNLVTRLKKLTPHSMPLWGKMNVCQMLAHCQKPMDVAEGRLHLKGGLIGFLFGKMAKNSMLKKRSFGKNSPTAAEFKIAETPDFDSEWNVLISLVKKFGEKGPEVIVNKEHPFFGKMTDEEWGILQYTHIDHHLKQFDV